MAIDEQYLRIRRSLEEKLGVEEAFYLMDRPVGGWSELVTNQTLDLKLDAMRNALLAEMHHEMGLVRKELHAQTWKLMTAMIAAMGVMGALFAGLVTVVGT